MVGREQGTKVSETQVKPLLLPLQGGKRETAGAWEEVGKA